MYNKTPAGIVIENVGISPDINISTLVSRALKKTKDTGPLDKKMSKKENDDFSKRKYIINKAAIIMTNKHP
jgi:C-terminal processing protease CtpA/Prc